MGAIAWDDVGSRHYETGVDRVVIYVQNEASSWNGITAINESPSGAEPSKIYADNIVYGVVMSPEENAVTIEGFTYPDCFKPCIGEKELAKGAYVKQQSHVSFGLCWRSLVGNDRDGLSDYKLHIIPKLFASPSEDSNSTINDSPEQKTFSFSATAISVQLDEDLWTSSIIIDSRKLKAAGLANAIRSLEDVLYGTENTVPKIPKAGEILTMLIRSRMLLDSSGNSILDSSGDSVLTFVSN